MGGEIPLKIKRDVFLVFLAFLNMLTYPFHKNILSFAISRMGASGSNADLLRAKAGTALPLELRPKGSNKKRLLTALKTETK